MTETMKAIVMHEFGGPEVLGEPEEVPLPVPGPHQVLVEVNQCSVCYLDTIVRSGVRPGTPLPLILGHEIAGVVVDVGSAVQGWRSGDKVASTYRGVCGRCWYCRHEQSVFCRNIASAGVEVNGGYAEYVALNASSLAQIPDGVADSDASIAGCVLGAVYKGVTQKGRVQPGDTVLVTGASGGAGLHAVQLAALAGAKVLAATTSAEKAQSIIEQGAYQVLSGAKEEIVEQVMAATHGRGVTVALECVGQPTTSLSLRCLAPGGRLVYIGAVGVEPARVSIPKMLYQETEIVGVASPNAGELAELLELIADGRVKPVISDIFPLAKAGDAHAMLRDRSNLGRVSLAVSTK
ncbi:MAG: alcohol dehydrogenase catalytic domain-containing protein [Acidimicrobiia bacterium]